MKRCIIFGAGDACKTSRLPEITKDDFVIAADGGYLWTQREHISVHCVLGDMDSLAVPVEREKQLVFPVEKDDTDMGLAVSEGRRFGCREFYLYGGTGGRADHTYANYQLLVNIARRGERGYLVDDRMTATAVTADEICIRGRKGAHMSVFAVDNSVEGVTLRGLKYSLEDHLLCNDYALGVSNCFTDEIAVISAKKGTLLVLGEYLPNDIVK